MTHSTHTLTPHPSCDIPSSISNTILCTTPPPLHSSSKLRSRFFLGGTDYSILQTHFQGQLHTLPELFGGTAPNDRISPWLTEEVKQWQLEQNQDKGGKEGGKDNKDNDTTTSADKLPSTSKLP